MRQDSIRRRLGLRGPVGFGRSGRFGKDDDHGDRAFGWRGGFGHAVQASGHGSHRGLSTSVLRITRVNHGLAAMQRRVQQVRRLTMAAAAVVGAIGGGAVLGDDHMSGEHVDCSYVPWDCLDECLELKWCVAIPENDGIADCLSERWALAACEADPGGGPGGGGGVIIVPTCPGGQHYHAGGGCHGDHECGDDEIGGGSEECEPCTDGEVPNEDKTACVSCEWGESPFEPGRCRCDAESLDALATQLRYISKTPWEEAEKYKCGSADPSVSGTRSTKGQADVCNIDLSWGETIGVVGLGHSHPYFDPNLDYAGGVSFKCGAKVIDSGSDALIANDYLWDFSGGDTNTAHNLGVPVYLVVPHRTQVKVYRPDTGEEIIWEAPWTF
ncbi:MAG: hypothetical protein OXI79_07385 [Gammaproteobacteria bacterium]|nr:hypothetical protein [Gammaproteobacteria bacterium]